MKNTIRCECGDDVSALGMAAHLRGNFHRTGVMRSELKAQGYVELPGTTRGTVTALLNRGFDAVAMPHWAGGSSTSPGYESATAAVRLHEAIRIAENPKMPRAAYAGANKAAPVHGPKELVDAISQLEVAVLHDLAQERGES